MGRYDDIIHLERPVSRKHVPMSLTARAAQFAPFAALNGYNDAIEEESRETEREVMIADEQKERIGRLFIELDNRLRAGERPVINITRYIWNVKKPGGEYRKQQAEPAKVRLHERILQLRNGETVHIEDIRNMDILM